MDIILICIFAAALAVIITVVNKYREYLKDYINNKNHVKALSINVLITIGIICLIAVFFSTVVCQDTEEVYGVNTPCKIINTDSKYYHASDCSKLKNKTYKEPLWIVLSFGYEECPNCTKNSKYHKTCYFTDTGDCFHYKGCRYLKHSAHETTVIEALGGGFDPCSYCVSGIDPDKTYYIESLGNYFHTYGCSRSCEPKIKFTTSNVYQAKENGYTTCSKCDVGELDITHKRTPIDNHIIISIMMSIVITFGLYPFLKLLFDEINYRFLYPKISTVIPNDFYYISKKITSIFYIVTNRKESKILSFEQKLYATTLLFYNEHLGFQKFSISKAEQAVKASQENKIKSDFHEYKHTKLITKNKNKLIFNLVLQIAMDILPSQLAEQTTYGEILHQLINNKKVIRHNIQNNIKTFRKKSISQEDYLYYLDNKCFWNLARSYLKTGKEKYDLVYSENENQIKLNIFYK